MPISGVDLPVVTSSSGIRAVLYSSREDWCAASHVCWIMIYVREQGFWKHRRKPAIGQTRCLLRLELVGLTAADIHSSLDNQDMQSSCGNCDKLHMLRVCKIMLVMAY